MLVVDDEKDIVFVLKSALDGSGYITDSAADGLEALKKVASFKPDLIILDIMMPVLDGYSVNLRLRENPETAGIPVVIVTGKGHMQEFLKAREGVSVAAYLEKPFKVATLLSTVNEILQRQ